ncbi:hypothetical protein HNQ77_000121 [Silvibacterium bohemicum]|uniref:Uncharacterized protein n=1 Tax=Silvibacterium bohemicum TaxID=1577686 RepID=A0A841JLU5_9BACT|nr:hypothetical protein [Silvibacterium bohemicum]MBB6142183.1 hypothetical protein [Silvibacterium bohemicum]
MRVRRDVLGALLLAVSFVLRAGAQVALDAPYPASLKGGAGSEEFKLSYSGRGSAPLKLKAGPFLDPVTHTILPPPKVSFVLEAGGAPLPARLSANAPIDVVAQISGFAGASVAQASLYNGNNVVGVLKLVEADAPLNITIDSDRGSDKPMDSVRGSPVQITLKNGDAETYVLNWSFRVDAFEPQTGTITLPASQTETIHIQPPSDAYSIVDFVHPTNKTGILELSLAAGDHTNAVLLPERSLPIRLSMMRQGSAWTSILRYGYVAVLLFLGGLLSVIGTGILPKLLKKIDLRNQIDELADRTSSVSTRVDSYLRVLLRLERKKIEILYQGISAIAPPDSITQIAAAIDRLGKRLAAAEHLDELRRRFEEATTTAPPSVTEQIDLKLQSAAEHLHAFALPDEDLKSADDFMSEAEDCLAMLGDSAKLAAQVAASFAGLKLRLVSFPASYYADLMAALPGLFDILQRPFDDPKQIAPRMLFAIDHGVAAMQIALDYAMVRASVASANTMNCDEPGRDANARLTAHECQLVELLGTLCWRSLRTASNLVQQMREDVYEQDVLDEIDRPRQAEIVFDTQKARPYLPVYFSIAFKDRRFDGAAAIRQLVSRWDFPNDLHEDGWKVCHFFQGDESDPQQYGKVDIKVVIQGQHGTEPGKILESKLHIQSRVRKTGHARFRVEIMQFFIAFGVALAGLLSGALEQLTKLDFVPATVAIVALGFGADSVKNLLTQNPKNKG